MELLKKWGLKLVGKKIVEDGIEKVGLSKAKATAIVGVVIVAVEQLSTAWGHPITIPPYIKEFLMGLGLWTLRDGMK